MTAWQQVYIKYSVLTGKNGVYFLTLKRSGWIEKKMWNISLNQITQSIRACRDMCWFTLVWSVHSMEITGAKQKKYLTSHTGQDEALALPNTVSFKSGSIRNRTKFLLLFYSCWYQDLTPPISQNSSVVFPASHCSDHHLEYKIVKNVEIYSNCAPSPHVTWRHVTDCCYLMALPGSSRLLSGSVNSNIRVEVPLSPDSLTARLPAIIVISVAAKVIWWLHHSSRHQDLLLSLNY